MINSAMLSYNETTFSVIILQDNSTMLLLFLTENTPVENYLSFCCSRPSISHKIGCKDSKNLTVFSHYFPLFSVFLPPANQVCEGNVFTGVCLSTGGVCHIACWKTPPHADTPLPLGRHQTGQTPPPGRHPPAKTPPVHSAYWDTVNNPAVRIPLECILVTLTFCLSSSAWL